MNQEQINILAENVFGSVESRVKYVWRENRCDAYGYAIHYDRDGNETKRTEPEWLSSCHFGDEPASQSLWKRFLKWLKSTS